MGCDCKKTYSIGMGCCQPVLAPADNYYTKYQTELKIEEAISGLTATTGCCITPEEVESAITSAMTIVEGEIPSLSGYATEQWVEDKHYITGVDLSDYALKSEIPTIPTSNTAFTNDAGYITSAYTYDRQTIDEKVASGGSFDPTQYYTTANTYNKTEVNNLLADKLDASAYTPTDLSQYWTSAQTESAITQATSGKAETSAVTNALLEKVNVVDNEVPAYNTDTEYTRYFPSSSATTSYADGASKIVVNMHRGGQYWDYYISMEVIDESGNTESGSSEAWGFNESNINPLPEKVDSSYVRDDYDYTFTYVPKAGYKISYADIYQKSDNSGAIVGGDFIATTKLFDGGQSADVIQNIVEPELDKLSDEIASKPTYTAGDGIDITNNVISTTTKFWCGTQAEYEQISPKDNNTVYMIHD